MNIRLKTLSINSLAVVSELFIIYQVSSPLILKGFEKVENKDADNEVIGMTMVATPQSSILRAAGRSVELTFLLVASLLLLSVVPIYYISKSLVRQIK